MSIPAPAHTTVFVSSTRKDLEHQHAAVVNLIRQLGFEVTSMLDFTAENQPTEVADAEKVRSCRLFVLLLAHRYGESPKGKQESYVELEYEVARAANKDRLIFLADDGKRPMIGTGPHRNTDDGTDWTERYQRLERLKHRIRNDAQVQPTWFAEDTDLMAKVAGALRLWADKNQAQGEPLRAQATAPTHPTPATAAILDDYRRLVRERHSYLPLIGFPKTVRMAMPLEELYVELHAVAAMDGKHRQFHSAKDADDHEALRGSEHCVALAVVFSMATRQEKSGGFVLLGDPGAGKTTHLRRMALACVTEGKGPRELGLPDDVLPMFLPLRLLQHGEDLAAAVPSLLARSMEIPAQQATNILTAGKRWLFLLDGLDEVPKASRQQVSRAIAQLRSMHPDSHFAITSRYAGYSDDIRLDEHFLELHLRPLRDDAIAQFVHNWYRIVEGVAGGTQAKNLAAANAQDLLTRLDKASTASRRVGEMAANPLLLTIICLVHRDRGRILPDSRIDLYDDCLTVLLERWRGAKGLAVQWTAKDAQSVLEPVALALHRRQVTRLPGDQLEPVVAKALQGVNRKDVPTAIEFLQDVRDDSGVLVGWSNDEFGFLHLGFQEHLAAKAIHRSITDDALAARTSPWLERLVAGFGDSWWEEVLLLLLAAEGTSLFGPLFARIITTPQFAAHPQLLQSCLAEARTRDVTPFLKKALGPKPGPLARMWAWVSSAAAQRLLQTERTKEVAIRVVSQLSPDLLPAELRHAAPSSSLATRVVHGCELLRVPAGEFLMGSEPAKGGPEEHPQHRVVIQQPFWLAHTAVTNRQYRAFVEARNYARPETWKDRRFNGDDQPVVGVSWEDAQAFCTWAGLRLPSEAEWEYACRAGTVTPFSFGENITPEQVNYDGNFPYTGSEKGLNRERTVPVGSLPANPWGLHEMHGNVVEWCQDAWHDNYEGAPLDGTAWEAGGSGLRVVRGGSWFRYAWDCRSASRYGRPPGNRLDYVGFRPASSSL